MAQGLLIRRRQLRSWAYVSPVLLIVGIVTIAPLGYGIYLSLTNWSLFDSTSPHFQGIGAYRDVLGSSELYAVLLRTVGWTAGTLAIELVIGLPLALLLNIRTPVTGVVTGLVLLPWITPFVVLAYAWLFLYDGMSGPLHGLLHDLHIVGSASPLTSSTAALWAVTVISGWKGVPFMTVGLLAARKGISAELYEASAVDGAGAWQRFTRITLPLLLPTVAAMSIVLSVQAFYSFDLVWLTTQGGPGTSSRILGVQLYSTFFTDAKPGQAAALGTLMLVVLILAVIPVLRRGSDGRSA